MSKTKTLMKRWEEERPVDYALIWILVLYFIAVLMEVLRWRLI